MESGPKRIALVYDEDAYADFPESAPASADSARVLWGRRVAGMEFLSALLEHGTWSDLVGLTYNQASAQALGQLWQMNAVSRDYRRRLLLVDERKFHQTFFPTPPAAVLHLPCPPVARYAWARQHGGAGTFALSGVTHTLCALPDIHGLCELVTAPYESYDALICTSSTAAQVVRAVTGTYADYLRDRHGGSPALRLQLRTIPLGVNTDRFHPPTSSERAGQRQALHIGEDEVAVLFVGRLSFHEKAHPFPMFQGLARATRMTGKKVHLILTGGSMNEAVRAVFVEGARALASTVRLSVVESARPEQRYAIWHAADIFTSLADNLQETFGLAVIEAMACGLPVVAAEWDGYRDLVVDGETGYLVPTFMMKDATTETTSRLLFGEMGYEEFLAECNQTVAVDVTAAAQAYARLIDDASLRRQFGEAGRQSALERFAWRHVIQAYEDLWQSQERARLVSRQTSARQPFHGPAGYPSPETSFASYPTAWLGSRDHLRAVREMTHQVEQFLAMPLINYLGNRRATDATLIREVLAAAVAPCAVDNLERVLRRAGVAPTATRATLAWMLKYGFLEVVPQRGIHWLETRR